MARLTFFVLALYLALLPVMGGFVECASAAPDESNILDLALQQLGIAHIHGGGSHVYTDPVEIHWDPASSAAVHRGAGGLDLGYPPEPLAPLNTAVLTVLPSPPSRPVYAVFIPPSEDPPKV
ncbi:MAG: hypothetical protein HY684_04215 [Chloroflexi bacterium]|nr:hypothetical protein [Chloroflexota bacterium]